MLTPLTSDQKIRLKVLAYVTGFSSQICDLTTKYGIAVEDAPAFEAQLVTWNLMVPSTMFPQPRYVMTNDGWTYIGISKQNGLSLTVPAILDNIPVGLFAGNSSIVSNSVNNLLAIGLITPTAGYMLNSN